MVITIPKMIISSRSSPYLVMVQIMYHRVPSEPIKQGTITNPRNTITAHHFLSKRDHII